MSNTEHRVFFYIHSELDRFYFQPLRDYELDGLTADKTFSLLMQVSFNYASIRQTRASASKTKQHWTLFLNSAVLQEIGTIDNGWGTG